MEENKTNQIELNKIFVDKELYPRMNVDWMTIVRYKSAMSSGSKFPPITLALFGNKYYLVDGMHRFKASEQLKRDKIDCELISVKSKKEIYLEAVRRNINHGKPFYTQEIAKVIITLENFKFTPLQISEMVHIPTDKLTPLVMGRAVLITNPQTQKDERVTIKSPLKNLAGTYQDISFENEQTEITGGDRSQATIVENLIQLIKNSWIDITSKEVVEKLTELKTLLNAMPLVIPQKAKKVKTGKAVKVKKTKK